MIETVLPHWLAEGAVFRQVFKLFFAASLLGFAFVEFWGVRAFSEAERSRLRPYTHSVAAAAALLGILISAIEIFDDLKDPTITTLMSPEAFWWAAAAAICLYWLRSIAATVYGSLEIGVGLMGLGIAANTPALTPPGQLFALMAAIYVIVRGLDNIDRGLAPSAQQKWRSFWQYPRKQPPPAAS